MNFVPSVSNGLPHHFFTSFKEMVAAARFAVTYAILFALELTVLPLLTGTWNFILGAAVGIIRTCFPDLLWDISGKHYNR